MVNDCFRDQRNHVRIASFHLFKDVYGDNAIVIRADTV